MYDCLITYKLEKHVHELISCIHVVYTFSLKSQPSSSPLQFLVSHHFPYDSDVPNVLPFPLSPSPPEAKAVFIIPSKVQFQPKIK